MAMNKKEKAALAHAQEEAQLAFALRWTCPVVPDVPPPTDGEVVYGWSFNMYRATHGSVCDAVFPSWSRSHSHGEGSSRSGSQGSAHQYSARERAWRALRHAVERDCARRLALIDAEIINLTNKHWSKEDNG